MATDLATALAALHADGYVILRELLPPSEIAALKAALAPLEDHRPHGRNNFEGENSTRVYSLIAKHPAFAALAEHPRVVALLDAYLLPNWLLSTMQSIRLHPGETAQPWHSDDIFYRIPRPRQQLALGAIWAIEEFTVQNGATELIPGSHLWADEHPDERAHTSVFAEMPAGSVVLFDGATWHRGGANCSPSTRLAISPQYCQPWLRTQESQLLIAPPDIARTLSPRVQSMLGYSIHPPFVGQVDGMNPQRLVDPGYKSGARQHLSDAAQAADRLLARPDPKMEEQWRK